MRSTWKMAGAAAVAVLSWAMPARAAEQAVKSGEVLSSADGAWETGARPIGCQECAECNDGCGSYDSCCRKPPLLGIIQPSDHGFDGFISPITNTVFFEDPRTLTEARLIFADHNIPSTSPIGGGDVQLYALQLRAALTERLSVIATKDGYLSLTTTGLGHREGWADVMAGLKYNLVRDVESQFLLSAGLTFEMDTGTHHVFQGRGDGEFHAFLTGGKELLPGVHWISGSGFRLPTDTVDRSQMWYWSNHLDKEIWNGIYGLVELHWFHWMKSGQVGPVGVEGNDIFNLGSPGVAGNDIVTLAVGGKYKPAPWLEIGSAFEFPLTKRRDLFDNRLTVDCIVRY
jgi:hypothetical protein